MRTGLLRSFLTRGTVLAICMVINTAKAETWAPTGSLNTASTTLSHTDSAAVQLADGRVLICGGRLGSTALNTAEVYNPTTGTWSFTGSLPVGRRGHTATLLNDGKVLVAGGENYAYCPTCSITPSAIHDPSTGTWSVTNNLNNPRNGHRAILLNTGKVLVAGGVTQSGTRLKTAELYDPATAIWKLAASMNHERLSHSATLLSDGSVLVCGGASGSQDLNTAEIFEIVKNGLPTADAGPDITISPGAGCQASVKLDGTGSKDPDGDTLSYSWTGSYGTASGATPTVLLSAGTHTITLTVDDGRTGTASDTVVVTVQDTTPPLLSNVPAPTTVEQTSPAVASATVPFPTAADNCGSVIVTSDASAVFPPGTTTVTFTAKDAKGNTATASTTVTVKDTTPPSIPHRRQGRL